MTVFTCSEIFVAVFERLGVIDYAWVPILGFNKLLEDRI